MPKKLCVYLQGHQPYRIAPTGPATSEVNGTAPVFANQLNEQILQRVAERCYGPVARLLKKSIDQSNGLAKYTLSMSGTLIEQLERWAPQALGEIQSLCPYEKNIEVLSEPYFHSLSSCLDLDLWAEEVSLHKEAIQRVFNRQPTHIRNTELIYSDAIARRAAELGFEGILAEGTSELFETVRTNQGRDLSVLLRSREASDEIGFRFFSGTRVQHGLSPAEFIRLLPSTLDETIMVGIDIETLGEHLPLDGPLGEFLLNLPEALSEADWEMVTPSDLSSEQSRKTSTPLFVEAATSWADHERDLSAWLGNRLQNSALSMLWSMRPEESAEALHCCDGTWAKLLGSDHFYYMCTKAGADGAVHQHFNAFESPFDAYLEYMDGLNRLKAQWDTHA